MSCSARSAWWRRLAPPLLACSGRSSSEGLPADRLPSPRRSTKARGYPQRTSLTAGDAIGPQVLSGLVVHPFDDAVSVLKEYRKALETAPDDLTCWVVMRQAPPL